MTGYSASPASTPALDKARVQLSRRVQQSADLKRIHKALLLYSMKPSTINHEERWFILLLFMCYRKLKLYSLLSLDTYTLVK